VPRRERALEPDSGPLTEFAAQLRILREEAGSPPYRELARRAHYSSSTLSDAAGGRKLPGLDIALAYVRACGGDEDAWRSRWHDVASALARSEPVVEATAMDDQSAPYVGLAAFTSQDADLFFGREAMVDKLLTRLSVQRFVTMFGASGEGKSSLLSAGLIPRFVGDRANGGHRPHIVFTPGPHPVEELAIRLAGLLDRTPGHLHADFAADPRNLHRLVRHLLSDAPPEIDLIVVVDQCEEIFTLCHDPDERTSFIALLLAAVSEPGSRLRVVLSVRSDFYPHCAQHPDLVKALDDGQVLLGAMTVQEFRRAVTRPAATTGCAVEAALLTQLVADASGRAGTLPLVSHALLQTWRRRRGNTLTLAGYQAVGGIRSALAHTAETVWTSLSGPRQRLARQLLLRLTALGDGTQDTKRRIDRAELTGLNDDLGPVLHALADARLITLADDTVSITHEALFQAWPRLRGWLEEDRSGHRLHRQLTEAAREWEDAGRDPGALYRGVRLDAAVDWVTNQGHRGELNQSEQQFVDASVQANQAESLRERRRTRKVRRLAAALGVLLLLSVAATIYSFQQRATAERERNLTLSRQIAGTANRLRDSDPALASQLAVAAYRIAPTVEARSSVLTASVSPAVTRMLRPGGAAQAVAVNPAGTLLAAAGAARSDTTVLLWDLRDPDRPALLGSPLTGHTEAIWAAAFSPDGTTVATGSDDDTVRLWNVSDPAHPKAAGGPLTGPHDDVIVVEFSPDGSMLAVGSRDGTLRLWDVRDRERPLLTGAPLTAAEGEVRSAAFAPTGNVLAVADGKKAVRLWDIADRQHPRLLGSPLALSSRVNTVAFSPDGMTLAAGSNDGTVRLWTMTDPAQPTSAGQLTRETGWVNAITFSTDGTMLAAASDAGSVQVWDLTRRQLRLDLPHAEPVVTVAFREQDQALYTNSADGIARRWLVPGPVLPTANRQITGMDFHPTRSLLIDGGTDLQLWDVTDRNRPTRAGPPLTAPPDSDRLAGTVAISPDGRTVAAATRAGNNVLLWDITTLEHPQQTARLPGHTALIKHVTFNHRGDLLASAAEDGTILLWSLTNRGNPSTPILLSPGIGFVFAVEFSPDDQMLAAVTQNGYLALWDLRDPRHPTAIGTPIAVAQDDARSLAISPDGHTLAIGIADGTVRLWDIENPSVPAQLGRPITGPDGFMHDVVFNPSGTVLVGGGAGQTWLWDVTDRTQPHTMAILPTPKPTTWRLRFSPDGQTLATANGNIQLWDTDPERVIRGICASSGDGITRSEWEKHIPDASYQPICH
jgi:WD40 repeat protein